MTNSLTPVEVAKYSLDFVKTVIRHTTNWSSMAELGHKAHLEYLENYLQALKVATVVLETDYIDRAYIEDYSEYYARCFQNLERKCVRLHFFTEDFFEESFLKAIEEKDQKFIKKHITAPGAYAGFVVIRPLPVTCIARMCLRPYDFDNKVKIIRKEIKVSLCGITLPLETAAFLEQDKVVSACATSAIWALLNASQVFNGDMPPSPSAITKAALSTDAQGVRVFPAAAGLQIEHVCRALKTYGLEATVIDSQDYQYTNHGFINKAKSILAAYIESGIPVLIGGTVIDINEKGEQERLGDHLVCAMGYGASKDTSVSGDGEITKIYVHDDRYGPYVSLREDPTKRGYLLFELKQNKDNEIKFVHQEWFVPKVLIIGLYHKVRIDFDYIYNISTTIKSIVKIFLQHTKAKPEEFKHFAESSQRISLCCASDIKTEVINYKNGFQSFNGTSTSSLLLSNLPRYIWRARFLREGSLYLDILFDATGVPQGDLIIGAIANTEDADTFWRALGEAVDSESYRTIVSALGQDEQSLANCITRFFSAKDENLLDTRYGKLRLPTRTFRKSEIKPDGDQAKRPHGTIKRLIRGTDARAEIEALCKEKKYIWVIDRSGDFIFGEEDSNPEKALGHPTLTQGGVARLAGELNFDAQKKCWEINCDSGAYSAHLKNDTDNAKDYLKSVLEMNLKGPKIKIESPPSGKKKPSQDKEQNSTDGNA